MKVYDGFLTGENVNISIVDISSDGYDDYHYLHYLYSIINKKISNLKRRTVFIRIEKLTS